MRVRTLRGVAVDGRHHPAGVVIEIADERVARRLIAYRTVEPVDETVQDSGYHTTQGSGLVRHRDPRPRKG